MPPEGQPYHVDWVVGTTANCHVANHRDWFTSFTPFESEVAAHIAMPDAKSKVEGIGTVELILRVYDTRPERAASNFKTLVLQDVLYVPDFVCNVVGDVTCGNYQFSVRREDEKPAILFSRRSGERLGMIARGPLLHLRLWGRSADDSSLATSGAAYIIGAVWSDRERQRWLENKRRDAVQDELSRALFANLRSKFPMTAALPYTDSEKEILKGKYRGEYHFLQMHGLSIHKEEEREVGRILFRAILLEVGSESDSNEKETEMEKDKAGDEEDEDEEDEDEEDESDIVYSDFEAELEADPMSHLADYHFSNKQLKAIKKGYGNTSNFMLNYGLKPYNDGDCAEAVAIANAVFNL